MSDEEKKAIETLKEKIAKSNKYVLYVDYSDLLDLLNIIENQQKEIEEKNIAINKMSKDISRQLEEIEKLNFENHMIKKWNEQLDKNCISKDKIREKIQEIDVKGTFDAKIVLEHLLEEK